MPLDCVSGRLDNNAGGSTGEVIRNSFVHENSFAEERLEKNTVVVQPEWIKS
jgi:hypothetical protein